MDLLHYFPVIKIEKNNDNNKNQKNEKEKEDSKKVNHNGNKKQVRYIFPRDITIPRGIKRGRKRYILNRMSESGHEKKHIENLETVKIHFASILWMMDDIFHFVEHGDVLAPYLERILRESYEFTVELFSLKPSRICRMVWYFKELIKNSALFRFVKVQRIDAQKLIRYAENAEKVLTSNRSIADIRNIPEAKRKLGRIKGRIKIKKNMKNHHDKVWEAIQKRLRMNLNIKMDALVELVQVDVQSRWKDYFIGKKLVEDIICDHWDELPIAFRKRRRMDPEKGTYNVRKRKKIQEKRLQNCKVDQMMKNK